MKTRRDVFQAIADPTRRAILTLLATHACTPGALAEHFNSTRQTVSKHIQILLECELVAPQTTGREIHYKLNAEKMKTIADFLEPFKAIWEQRFQALDDILKQMQQS